MNKFKEFWKNSLAKGSDTLGRAMRRFESNPDMSVEDLTQWLMASESMGRPDALYYARMAFKASLGYLQRKTKSGVSKGASRPEYTNWIWQNEKRLGYRKQALFDGLSRAFKLSIHEAIDEVMDYIEDTVPPEDRPKYK